MKLQTAFLVLSSVTRVTQAFTPFARYDPTHSSTLLWRAKAPPGGLSFEETMDVTDFRDSIEQSSVFPSIPDQTNRGKVNEIDFCMSPSDFSLSRLYQSSSSSSTSSSKSHKSKHGSNDMYDTNGTNIQRPTMSLTRALNNASNRAVRRILLSRSWPSSEALNLSLRQVLAKESIADNLMAASSPTIESTVGSLPEIEESTAKCPVPRPILNVIMRGQLMNKEGDSDGKEEKKDTITDGNVKSSQPSFKNRSDEQWVQEQMQSFNETYGAIPGYNYAEAYMECILSLATKGVESRRVKDVMNEGVYEDAYRRLISVLKSVGVIFEKVDLDTATEDESKYPRMKISKRIIDQDFCLSMVDKINIKNEKLSSENEREKRKINDFEKTAVKAFSSKEDALKQDSDSAASDDRDSLSNTEQENPSKDKKRKNVAEKIMSFFRIQEEKDEAVPTTSEDENPIIKGNRSTEQIDSIKREDLGGVLLSADEPTMTRQLNVLSNIVQRALLFGGDQELLVLSETLKADQPAFIKRWYPDSKSRTSDPESEERPGVQFYNSIIRLLKDAYTLGVITDMNPPLPLSSSYYNAYERLTASLVQFGSGYLKPVSTGKKFSSPPKTPKEEFIRFREWEISLRQAKPDVSDYPPDLIGSWQVKDQIGGKTIGTSTVVFKPEGEVSVDPPLRGLRWRLDPGPTHLDTCTFQVLSEDGAILEYKGFMDRGARLESRFSRRSIKIRGAVSLQMRDGDISMNADDYSRRDMLPLPSEPGVTRFVMSKVFDLND